MKTKLTKLILTLLFVLAAAALTGCGGKAEGENGKKVIKIETNGRPAPFIETVKDAHDPHIGDVIAADGFLADAGDLG